MVRVEVNLVDLVEVNLVEVNLVEANLVDLVEVNFADLVEANLGTVPGSRTPWVTPPGMFFSFCLNLLICLPTGRSRLTRSPIAG